MKMTRLFVMALLVGSLSVLGCGDDESSGGSAGSGGTAGTGGSSSECTEGELCCIEVCVTNESFRTVCLDEYSDCTTGGGDEATCEAAAEETCTV